MVFFSIVCLLVMIVFFCIYSIRSMRTVNSYGGDYHNEKAEDFQLKKEDDQQQDESGDYVEYKDPDESSDFERTKDHNSEKDNTFEKVY